MTDDRTPLLERAECLGPYGLAALLLIIWALTGAGYFWPMWAWLGLGYVLALIAAVRWARHRSSGRVNRVITTFLACFTVLGAGQVLIWLMTGAGDFWPIWQLMTLALLWGLYWLLGGRREHALEERVDELTRTRAGTVDAQATELRRIERDLHDGAQSRLVALSMQIGRAEERLAGKGADADDLELLRQARSEATAAISELRNLARGIAPPILADRGLPAAVQSLADRTGSTVTVDAELDGRLPPAVENAAYFVVAEALTNTAKHAAGAPAAVTIMRRDEALDIVVSDRGPGGARADGSGLTGLRQRVEALDGTLAMISPPGHGTTISATLPCP